MNKPSNPLRMQDQEEDGLTPSQREKRDQEETIYRYIMRGGGGVTPVVKDSSHASS